MKKKDVMLLLLVIPILLLFNFSEVLELFLGIESSHSFYHNFSSMVFNRNWKEVYSDNVISSMFGVVMCTICNFMFGIYIYKDLCVSGTYYFVRQRNRKKWFVIRSLKVLLLVTIYSFLQVVIPALICMKISNQPLNKFVVLFVAFSFVSMAAYNFLTTYFVNLIALKIGSVMSFVVVYIAMALCFELAYIFNVIGIPEYPVTYFLPTEITQIDMDVDVQSFKELFKYNKNTFISLGVNCAYIIVTFIIGLFIVDYTEISLVDRENLLG